MRPVPSKRGTRKHSANSSIISGTMRSRTWAILVFVIAGIMQGQQFNAPPDPYVSKGVCPFECCSYGDWIANRDLTVLDRPNGKPVAQLERLEHVAAITGEIETHPIRFQIRQNGPNSDNGTILAGSTVYLLHPVGEGFWLIWFRGKVVEMDLRYDGPDPRYQWWAQIKTRSGKVGWIRMNIHDLQFDHIDSCG